MLFVLAMEHVLIMSSQVFGGGGDPVLAVEGCRRRMMSGAAYSVPL